MTVLRSAFDGLVRMPAVALIALARAYQWLISPILGQHCRFEPTCSVYFIESIRKHGAIKGSLRGILRICRCHPWHPGGHDPP